MEQQVIFLVNQHFGELYIRSKSILLHQDSYHPPINPQALLHYFKFIEAALQKPYNRIESLSALVSNEDSIANKKMYPLMILKTAARQQIQEIYAKAAHYANGLELGGFTPISASLYEEEVPEE